MLFNRIPQLAGGKPARIYATKFRQEAVLAKWADFNTDIIRKNVCNSCGKLAEGFWIDGFETTGSNNTHAFTCLLCASDFGPCGYGRRARICKCEKKEIV